MENEKAKELMQEGRSVFFQGIKYEKINALIFRQYDKDNLRAFAELQDMNLNSIYIVPISKIQEGTDQVDIELNQRLKEVLRDFEQSSQLVVDTVYSKNYEKAVERIYEAVQQLVTLEKEIEEIKTKNE